jgi:hypothetical protein
VLKSSDMKRIIAVIISLGFVVVATTLITLQYSKFKQYKWAIVLQEQPNSNNLRGFQRIQCRAIQLSDSNRIIRLMYDNQPDIRLIQRDYQVVFNDSAVYIVSSRTNDEVKSVEEIINPYKYSFFDYVLNRPIGMAMTDLDFNNCDCHFRRKLFVAFSDNKQITTLADSTNTALQALFRPKPRAGAAPAPIEYPIKIELYVTGKFRVLCGSRGNNSEEMTVDLIDSLKPKVIPIMEKNGLTRIVLKYVKL